MYLWFQGLGLLTSGVQSGARGGGGRGVLVPMDEGGEEVPKVTQCPGGFSPGVPKTKHNFHCD